MGVKCIHVTAVEAKCFHLTRISYSCFIPYFPESVRQVTHSQPITAGKPVSFLLSLLVVVMHGIDGSSSASSSGDDGGSGRNHHSDWGSSVDAADVIVVLGIVKIVCIV